MQHLINLPKITVVTPSFNQGAFLEATIRSVIEQDYPNLEYLILDGGSTDDSPAIIQRYLDHFKFSCSAPDGGQTAALIRGFDMATGEIYCWLNSDDVFEEGCLWRVAKYFTEHPESEMIFGNAIFIDKKGEPTRKYRPAPFRRWTSLYSWVDIPQPSTFFRARLYERVGGLDPRYSQVYMDSDLWLRFSELTRPTYVPEYWSKMRMYPEIKSIRMMDLYNSLHIRNTAHLVGTEHPSIRFCKHLTARVLRLCFRWYRDNVAIRT